jgi:methylmalonyl-CoA/ethylmalonyl-CoA epimerase
MMTSGRLAQVAQRAADLDRATAFYRDVVGLRFLQRFDPPGLAFFDLGGGTRLLLEGAASSAVLYLATDDLDATVDRLRDAGVEIVSEPHVIHVHDGTMAPDGVEERMAFFLDSEGNTVGLCEQREALRRD